ncbi:MAG TPA: hypothetical protein VGT00_02420 [Methylomirabilota bacterium]|nr:hypothetical protein [Methylomirabilota bacterium]
MLSRIDESEFDRAERIFADLVTKWDYLGLLPQQALEEVRAAAAVNFSVNLSPDSAEALAAMVDGVHTPRNHVDPRSDPGIFEVFGRMLLTGEFACVGRVPGRPQLPFPGCGRDYVLSKGPNFRE